MGLKNQWAIYIGQKNIQWSLGVEISQNEDEILLQGLLNLTTALSQFGEEFFGEGLGLIDILPDYLHFTQPQSILLIRLSNEFYFLCSNPLVTAWLIEQSDMPVILNDQLRSVLIGAALTLYSNYWGHDLFISKRDRVDEVFNLALRKSGAEERGHISKGECSLSQLTLSELIRFHYHLRKLFEKETELFPPIQWALVHDSSGLPIYLQWNLDDLTAMSLSGLLSVINNFIQSILNAKLHSLQFGVTSPVKILLSTGQSTLLAIAGAEIALNQKELQKMILALPPHILTEIQEGLKRHLVSLLLDQYEESLKTLSVPHLLRQFKQQKRKIQTTSTTKEITKTFAPIARYNLRIIQNASAKKYINLLSAFEQLKIVVYTGNENLLSKIGKILGTSNQQEVSFEFETLKVPIYSGSISFNLQEVSLQIWFLSKETELQNEHILTKLALNTDGLIVPCNLKKIQSPAAIKNKINLFWNYSGKTFIPTEILVIDHEQNPIKFQELINVYKEIKIVPNFKKIDPSLTLNVIDLTNDENFKQVFTLLISQILLTHAKT